MADNLDLIPESRDHDVSNMVHTHKQPSDQSFPRPLDFAPAYDLSACHHRPGSAVPTISISDDPDGHYPHERQQHLERHLTSLAQSLSEYPPEMDPGPPSPHGVHYEPVNLPFLQNGEAAVHQHHQHHHHPPPQPLPLMRYASSTGSLGGDHSATEHGSPALTDLSWPNDDQHYKYNYNYNTPLYGYPDLVDPRSQAAPGTPSTGQISVRPQDLQHSPDPTSDLVFSPSPSQLEGVGQPRFVPDCFQQHPAFYPQDFDLSVGEDWERSYHQTSSPPPPPAIVVDPAIDDPPQGLVQSQPFTPEKAPDLTATTTSFFAASDSFADTPTPPSHPPSSPAWSAAAAEFPLNAPSPSPATNPQLRIAKKPQHRRCVSAGSRPSSSSKHARKPSDRAKFACVFKAYGCDSVFLGKNEWKRHVVTIHLQLDEYECDLGDCASRSPQPEPGVEHALSSSLSSSPSQSQSQSSSLYAAAATAKKYNRPDLFGEHIRRMHAPWRKPYKPTTDERTGFERDVIRPVRDRCRRHRRDPPPASRCPFCRREFVGETCWDERMEHVGRHVESGEERVVCEDGLLKDWAVREGIVTLDGNGNGWVLADAAGRRRK